MSAAEFLARDNERVLSNNVNTNRELGMGGGAGTGDLLSSTLCPTITSPKYTLVLRWAAVSFPRLPIRKSLTIRFQLMTAMVYGLTRKPLGE
jgi:hypothetical protein